MLLWIDLETTGLVPGTDHVLEVAAVVTDDALREVARFERVCYHSASRQLAALPAECTDEQARAASKSIDPYVVKMHAANGLWSASATAGEDLASVDAQLAEFIAEHTEIDADPTSKNYGKPILPQLAGSTISFDRSFMAEDLPTALAAAHYRNLDVSSLNEMAKRFWPAVFENRPRAETAHRGMSDILASIETARYYASALQPSIAVLVFDPAMVSVCAAPQTFSVGAIVQRTTLTIDPDDIDAAVGKIGEEHA